jgi:large subunit ribosomal protein L7/L12
MATKVEELVQTIGGMSVVEVADLVKKLEEEFGVSAAMPVAAAPAAAAPEAAAAAEKSEYKVTLKDVGAKKIDVIKAIKKITNWGLTEAKKAVEEAPTVVADKASKDDAQKMKAALEEAGATVELS